MTKKLVSHVHVYDDSGNYVDYGPDDTVPADAAKQITNPDAWEASDEDHETEPTWTPNDGTPPPTRETPRKVSK